MAINKDLINTFIISAIEIVEELEGEKPRRGELSLIQDAIQTQGVVIVIGITGKIEGRLLLDVSKETACRFSEFILKEKFSEFNEIVESAMGEMANLITGRAVSILNEMGYSLKITPPTLLSGQELKVSDKKMEMLVIPLFCKSGKLLINIAIKITD